jgi:CheY-like chemotaxis protein
VTASGRARVLVVDDSEVVRRLIRINLELEGFDVFEACDAGECLALLGAAAASSASPAVVTLDVTLPDGPDGFAVLRRIKADPALGAARVVVVSAAAQTEDVRRGTAAGADAYITKPFEPQDLVDTVCRLAAGPQDEPQSETG